MDPQLKERLVGAAVLVVAGILFIPQLLDGPDERPAVKVGLELPAQDSARRTHTIRLDVPAERPATKSTGSIVPPVPAVPAPTPAPAAGSGTERQAGAPPPSVPSPTEPAPAEAPAKSAPESGPDEKAERPEARPAAAEEPAAAKPAPAPAAGDWAVQVGSFSSEDNAKRLQSRLNSAGFDTFQARLVTDSGTMHRVRVGPVADRAAAESLAARLGKAGYPGRVVPVGD